MILLRLLGILKWLREGLTSLLGLVRRYPLHAALIASLCLAGWLWLGKTAAEGERDAEIAGRKADWVLYEQASAANRAAQIAQVKAIEAEYERQAKDAQHAYDIALQGARTATDRYIAANRVRAGGCVSPASAPGEGSNPGIPAELPADSGMVAIRETDLQALVEWLAIGVSEHNRAVDKINAGLAEVEPAF